MPLKIAVQMDHVSTVSIAGDTTFALSLEAQRRGHKLFHYTPDRLSLRDGKVFARIEDDAACATRRAITSRSASPCAPICRRWT